MSFLKLIRFPNLLIIAFTMYIVRYCIINTIVVNAGHTLQMPFLYFNLLVAATILIAAAGYIINDYFDLKIDRINKPGAVVIDKQIKRRVAIFAHFAFNSIGLALAFLVSFKAHVFVMGMLLFLFSAASLWFYSTDFKRMLFIGNFLVAFLSAGVPFIEGFYEMAFLRQVIPAAEIQQFGMGKYIFIYTCIISFFAFWLTLLREIIKDIEDEEGDELHNCRTIPIVFGIDTAKHITAALTLVFIFFLAFLQTKRFNEPDGNLSFFYMLFFIQLPAVFLFYRLVTAKHKKDFTLASGLTKLIMLTGICFWFLFNYLINNKIW